MFLFADEMQIGLGAVIGVVATAITQLILSLYGKKKSSEIEASEHAFKMLTSIIDGLKTQIVEGEKKCDAKMEEMKAEYEKKIEILNAKIDKIKEQHQDSLDKCSDLEHEIKALKEKYVSKPNGTS